VSTSGDTATGIGAVALIRTAWTIRPMAATAAIAVRQTERRVAPMDIVQG